MRDMGLIRGASEANVIVLTDVGVRNGPLRYRDEFVRHKVLDLIGDLALLGRRIIGRIVADRAGHAMHTALVSRILKDHALWEETTLSAALPHAAASPELAAYLEKQRMLYPEEYAVPVPSLADIQTDGPSIVMAHSLLPEVLHHTFSAFGCMMSPDLPLERRQHEMIATMVSVTNRCVY